MTAPNPSQVRPGAASTPSTAVSATTPPSTPTAPQDGPTPDEVVFAAFQGKGWSAAGVSDSTLDTLALTAVLALRKAGFSL